MRPYLLHVVLVRTLYDSNIGATSRAMDNMGANDLILIGRKCEITYAAQQAAASGQKAFLNRKEYESWDDFFKNEPEGIRIAFSARDGRGRPLWDCKEVFSWLKEKEPRLAKTSEKNPVPIYLIFGPEDWGLANEDLELAHFNANIPTYSDNPSLNLAQAVLLALYTLRSIWGGERTYLDGQQPSRHIHTREKTFPEELMKKWLTEMGFDLTKHRINAYTVLKRMLLHNVPTQKELRILNIVLNQSIRKLQEYNELRKLKK